MMSTELGEMSETVNKSYLNLQYDLRYDDPKDPNRFFFPQRSLQLCAQGHSDHFLL